MDSQDAGYKVRLVSVASYYNAPGADAFEQVVFSVSPTLTESRRVEYNPVSPIHMPGSIQVYRSTASREFGLTAKFISRTPVEALANQQYLQLLRGWCEPYFGASSTLSAEQLQYRRTPAESSGKTAAPSDEISTAQQERLNKGVELLGAPPDVLYLYAYASNVQRVDNTQGQTLSGQAGINIHKVPVVITSLEITYPDDVDYIPTNDVVPSPFPTRLEVSISLVETHSPAEFERFSLSDFKRGRLVNF